MEKTRDSVLTQNMENFKEKKIDYTAYEASFRRWLVSELDSGRIGVLEACERFDLGRDYARTLKRWQEKYSEGLHVSLQSMSSKDRADNKKLDKRIKELEKQLELAQMKNVALNTMIDIAEQDYKLKIRKKPGPKQ